MNFSFAFKWVCSALRNVQVFWQVPVLQVRQMASSEHCSAHLEHEDEIEDEDEEHVQQ